eukprot:SAG11_NODE_7753_length_1100_cov_3.654346_1_plen_33_part_10
MNLPSLAESELGRASAPREWEGLIAPNKVDRMP